MINDHRGEGRSTPPCEISPKSKISSKGLIDQIVYQPLKKFFFFSSPRVNYAIRERGLRPVVADCSIDPLIDIALASFPLHRL